MFIIATLCAGLSELGTIVFRTIVRYLERRRGDDDSDDEQMDGEEAEEHVNDTFPDPTRMNMGREDDLSASSFFDTATFPEYHHHTFNNRSQRVPPEFIYEPDDHWEDL